jgi:nucleotide-binding universal stress UspA family protein
MAFRKILVPTDFSDSSREALRLAVDVARDSGATLTLFHAWDVPVYSYAEAMIPPSVFSDIAAEGEKQLAASKREAEQLGAGKVTTRLGNGPAWTQVVELLKQEPSFDLVVIGTHGRTGLKHALIGSVAEKVVRHAPCPVLVVRQRDDR